MASIFLTSVFGYRHDPKMALSRRALAGPRVRITLGGNFANFGSVSGHTVVPSASLVSDDPSLLFTVAGMVPFIPYLTGLIPAPYPRATSVQKCIRTNDIEEVGKTPRHGTFFQMNGNFSFGDYFKREQLPMIWQFLTERVGLDPNRIYVSCFSGDEANGIAKDTESADIWIDLFSAAGVSACMISS